MAKGHIIDAVDLVAGCVCARLRRQCRDAAGGTAVRFDGNRAGACRYCRRPADHHGQAVSRPAGRSRDFSGAGGYPAGGIHRYRRRYRRHHGPDRAADHVALRLLERARDRCHIDCRYARTNHSAVDRHRVAGFHRWRYVCTGTGKPREGDGCHRTRTARRTGGPVHRHAVQGRVYPGAVPRIAVRGLCIRLRAAQSRQGAANQIA